MSLSSLVLAPLQIQAALSVVRDDVSIEYTPMTATKILNELALLDHGARGMYTDAWSAANPTALRLVSWLA